MPADPQGFAISVAGLTARLSSSDPAWLDQARRRYSGFVVTRPADLSIRHRSRAGGAAGRVPQNVRADRRGTVLLLQGEAFTAEFDVQRREGTLDSTAEAGPLDVLLRSLIPILGDGLLLHGCAFSTARGGVLCCGPSGAGKSTIATLMPDEALCDELAAVRPDGGAFRLESLPYWHGRPGSVPLSGVFLLSHARGPDHSVARLPAEVAARRLLEHVAWPNEWPERMALRFDLATALATRVPVFDLAFRPRPDVARAIEGALS